jgi:hypothetical protein
MSTNVIPFPTMKLTGIRNRMKATVKDDNVGNAVAPFVGEATWETTPVIFPHVAYDIRHICTAELGADEFHLVPVHADADADPKNYVENVARRMSSDGGQAMFGWRIRTTPLYVAAEFHCMHQMDNGRFIDVTPNRRREAFVVFVPDRTVTPKFDYLDRSVTQRFITYRPPSRRERIVAEIAAMDHQTLTTESAAAGATNLALEDFLALRLGPDQLETRLELWIECSEEVERLTMQADDNGTVDEDLLLSLRARREALEALVDDAYAERKLAITRRRPVS